MGGAAAGDLGCDAAAPQQSAVFVVVVAAVGVHDRRALAGSAAPPTDGWDRLQQRDELRDVVAVAAGQRDRQRDAAAIDDQVVLGTWAGTVDQGRPDRLPPLSARTCEEATTAPSTSSTPPARSSASSTMCSRGHTPASVHSRSRRQQVTPEQPIISAGTSRHVTPVRSTYTIPASAVRSSMRRRPG